VERDRLLDYAARTGLSEAHAVRRLSPVLSDYATTPGPDETRQAA